jgi:putative membrane protein
LAQATTAHEGFWLRIIYIASALICAAVAFLILGPRPASTQGALDVSGLPLVNASLNGITTVLLLIGYYLIRKRRVVQHRRMMLAAFGTSSAFLVSYVIYHWFKSGPRPYTGDYRGMYLVILLTHIVLAAAIVPLALITLYRGWNNHVARHRRIARWTLPIWLYVSVTGVAIYAMLYL